MICLTTGMLKGEGNGKALTRVTHRQVLGNISEKEGSKRVQRETYLPLRG